MSSHIPSPGTINRTMAKGKGTKRKAAADQGPDASASKAKGVGGTPTMWKAHMLRLSLEARRRRQQCHI